MIENPITMNDWNIKKFLHAIFSIQVAMIALIGLDSLGFNLPILRQLVAFIYITFIPGIIILRVLRLHKLGSIRTILYAVGLSISTVVFTGFILNSLYPSPLSDPISLIPLMVAISAVVITLSLVSYLRDKQFSSPDVVDVKDILSPASMFLYLLPILSIFSTYSMNIYGNNLLQIILLLAIMAIPVMLVLGWIQKKYLPLAIFTISLSLLFHTTLITQYIWGADIYVEHFYSNLVIVNSHWDPAIYENVDAMLSIVMLAPAYSIISKLDLVWVFKIIYPLLFSLVPLGLFYVFKKYTDDMIAFLGCFFFVSIFTFYTVMPALARQQIAELFLVIILLLALEESMNKRTLNVLLMVFGASMVVSHYGITYIFMLILVISWLIAKCRPIVTYLWRKQKLHYHIVTAYFIIFLASFTMIWFMYIGRSSIFNNGVTLGYGIITSANSVLSPTPASSQILYLSVGDMQLFQSIERYIHLISLLLIVIGLAASMLKNYPVKPMHEQFILSLAGFAIAIMGFALPYFASALDSNRLYHIMLFFLAPFCIIGLLALIKLAGRIRVKAFNVITKKPFHIVSIYLVIFLLFNSAFIYQVFGEQKMGRFALDNSVNFMTLNNGEHSSVDWIKSHSNASKAIYADDARMIILYWMVGNASASINSWAVKVNKFNDSYVYLGTYNLNNNEMFLRGTKDETEPIKAALASNTSEIYNNSKSCILVGDMG